ncbi:MAG: hypothetical protein PVH61_17175 [Candidatus Aminicenantes bacterium]
MIQVEPADPENLPEQHLRHPEHAPCDRQPLFLTKEVIPIIENQATCMPGKIEENQPKMSTLKDTILKKDDIILYGSPMKISRQDTRKGAKKKWT